MESLLREIFRNELGIRDEAFSLDLAYNSTPEWDSASHLILIIRSYSPAVVLFRDFGSR